MDEDSVIANMAVSNSSPWDLMLGGQQEEDDSNQPQFIQDLKVEVLEVYAQLRTICADLSFRNGNSKSKPGSTPDELALLEMDFKLGSLRDTLSELHGLLSDLMKPPVVCHQVIRFGFCVFFIHVYQNGPMDSVMMRMEETRMVLDHKSWYLKQLQEEVIFLYCTFHYARKAFTNRIYLI